MKLNEYQLLANETATYKKSLKIIYPTLGLNGEAGEVAEKVKKVFRDQGGEFTEQNRADLVLELGDALWYIAAVCKDIGVSLEDVAYSNINKIRSRVLRGVLGGSGDNR